jgi:hypothetical protein
MGLFKEGIVVSDHFESPAAHSSFVSALAWLFIVIAGFSILISVLQNALLQEIFLPSMHQALFLANIDPDDVHAAAHASFSLTVWFFRSFLLACLITLTAAIGLLLRKEWARKIFIGLMGFAIVYQIVALVFQWWFVGPTFMHLPTQPNTPTDTLHMMHSVMTAMKIVGTLMAIGFGVLFGWIIKQLCSASIRREFVSE